MPQLQAHPDYVLVLPSFKGKFGADEDDRQADAARGEEEGQFEIKPPQHEIFAKYSAQDNAEDDGDNDAASTAPKPIVEKTSRIDMRDRVVRALQANSLCPLVCSRAHSVQGDQVMIKITAQTGLPGLAQRAAKAAVGVGSPVAVGTTAGDGGGGGGGSGPGDASDGTLLSVAEYMGMKMRLRPATLTLFSRDDQDTHDMVTVGRRVSRGGSGGRIRFRDGHRHTVMWIGEVPPRKIKLKVVSVDPAIAGRVELVAVGETLRRRFSGAGDGGGAGGGPRKL